MVDTIGIATPEAVSYLVGKMTSWAGPNIPLHFHGHNDFGLATAAAVAAVRAGAQAIVTFNKRHFPPASTSRWNVEAVGPAAFLQELYLAAPSVVTERIQQQATNLERTLTAQLKVLAKAVPSFVEIVRRDLKHKGD